MKVIIQSDVDFPIVRSTVLADQELVVSRVSSSYSVAVIAPDLPGSGALKERDTIFTACNEG